MKTRPPVFAEHATATGVALLARFAGICIARVLTPVLFNSGSTGVYDIPGMLMFYAVALISGVMGASLFSVISDKLRKRKAMTATLLICLILAAKLKESTMIKTGNGR